MKMLYWYSDEQKVSISAALAEGIMLVDQDGTALSGEKGFARIEPIPNAPGFVTAVLLTGDDPRYDKIIRFTAAAPELRGTAFPMTYVGHFEQEQVTAVIGNTGNIPAYYLKIEESQLEKILSHVKRIHAVCDREGLQRPHLDIEVLTRAAVTRISTSMRPQELLN